jgi:glycosyltransferase involved in cell wall biosynthesis
MEPVFSIVLCTYNAEAYLDECVTSLLGQTYANFELIIIDDGSTDETIKYLENIKDARVRLIALGANHGLIYARSQGFTAASGQYIAIMDADDIAHPQRLEQQLQAFQAKEIDVCGTFHLTLEGKTGRIRARKSYSSDSDIRALLCIYCPLCNPSTSIRSEVAKRIGYSLSAPHAEDYGFWCDIAIDGGKFFNIAKPLITYRLHDNQISKLKKQTAHNSFRQIQLAYIKKITGKDTVPGAMRLRSRLDKGLDFMKTINQNIPGISFRANYEIYAEFQYRRNGLLTLVTRMERVLVSLYATMLGRFHSPS